MFEKLEQKTILVTGASGFIGQHLVRRLQNVAKVRILALSRHKISHALNSVVLPLAVDLSHLTKEYWHNHGVSHIDIIFHLGAYTPKNAQDGNHIQPIIDDNISGMKCLFDSLPNPPECIIFSSTLDVYAPQSDSVTIDEQTPLGPINLYGASKLFGEQLIKAYVTQFQCRGTILRYGHIYGPGEACYKKFIPEMIRKLIANETPNIFGNGATLRDFLYIDDAIEATLRASVSATEELHPINIVSGQSKSLRTIMQYLLNLCGENITPLYLTEKPNGTSLCFDNRFMQKTLGIWELVSLDEGLKNEYESFKSSI